MAQKFPFAIWNYNLFGDFKPEEVDVWAECGLTVTLTERIFYGKDDLTGLIAFLDRAEEKGIMLIANVIGITNVDIKELTDEEYEKRFTEVYNLYKGHPALYGFYVGDDGKTMITYHAKPIGRDNHRCTCIHRVHFDKNGDPVFNMVPERDLPDHMKDITVKVIMK